MTVEEKIGRFNFHDLPFDKLCLDFENSVIKIYVSVLNKIEDAYDTYELMFKECRGIILDKMLDVDIQEFYSCNVVKLDELYSVEFVALGDLGQPSWKFKFIFKDLEIENPSNL
jgi:hypothetical protein